MKGFIPSEIFGRQLLDLFACADGIAVIIKKRAVVEIDAVERENWNYLDIFAGVWPARNALTDSAVFVHNARWEIRFAKHGVVLLQAKQFLDKMGHREDRRPHIKHKAISLADICPPAGCIQRLNDFGIEAETL